MKRILWMTLLVAIIAGAIGCKTHSGNREYIPGKGWILTD
jgi:hypothetical protein